MWQKLKSFFDITMLKFALVGIVNTLVGTATMLVSYNLIHLNYWVSSALNYVVGSVVSYVLNKHFTFQNKSKDKRQILRFIGSILLCYLIAYGIAKPICYRVLLGYGKAICDNVAMLIGMCLFICLNYVGQRFFVFKEDKQ